MRFENLLFSAVQFLLVLVVTCMGLFFVALPWAPRARFKCASFLVEREDIFIPLGGLLLVVALILGICFYFLQRRTYLQIRMNPSACMEKEVLRALLDFYWRRRFPESKLKTDIILHRDHKVEFVAELPSLESGEVEKLLGEVEEEIGKLLVHQLGYRKDFTFTFQLR